MGSCLDTDIDPRKDSAGQKRGPELDTLSET